MLQPPEDLYPKIITSVRYQEQLKALKKRLFWYASGFSVSVLLCLLSLYSFLGQVRQTQVFEFVSLLWSDFSVLKNNGLTFLLALVEQFPIMVSSLLAGSLLLVFGFFLKSFTTAFRMKHLNKYL